ncbi:hypothetical protein C8F04DRAFT_1064428 [Mycena alexandri]|uniref:Uncharacterized protein n=1 Tax=Mycena alexandri TaxID=1745969 RepID=A0AAD6XBP1_9AGAR|nr:hypothetical protein C8F04DRAFT_1064428 [Mycena alexandri]
MEQKKLGPPMLLPSVSFTVGTLEASPATPQERSTGEGPSSILHPPTPTRAHSDPNTRGKRKAEHIQGGITPPKDAKATGNLDPRPLQASHSTPSSTAPSSFKRAKTEPSPPRPGSRAGSVSAGHTGSASSRGSAPQPSRAPSRMSQASLPISALVAPHAPSVVSTNTAYHMRDPRKPPRIQPTGWGLEFGPGRWWQGGGSPLHAWLFFVGFVLFPVWWVAGLCVPIPRTRRLDAEEKSRGQVWLDDPQVEFDAKSWRKRCRIMAGVSLVTYVPFIVLLAVFLSRR